MFNLAKWVSEGQVLKGDGLEVKQISQLFVVVVPSLLPFVDSEKSSEGWSNAPHAIMFSKGRKVIV